MKRQDNANYVRNPDFKDGFQDWRVDAPAQTVEQEVYKNRSAAQVDRRLSKEVALSQTLVPQENFRAGSYECGFLAASTGTGPVNGIRMDVYAQYLDGSREVLLIERAYPGEDWMESTGILLLRGAATSIVVLLRIDMPGEQAVSGHLHVSGVVCRLIRRR